MGRRGLKTDIGDVMRESYLRGWITRRDGNISMRGWSNVDRSIIITPSGVDKRGIFSPDLEMIKLDKYGEIIEGDADNPSGELMMHHAILRYAMEPRSVVHVHATHIVAAMYAGYKLPEIAKEFPEVHRYTKVGPNVRALPATSEDLAEETAVALGVNNCGNYEFDIVGQDRHGVCAIGYNPWVAFEHIERLDHICKIVLLGRSK